MANFLLQKNGNPVLCCGCGCLMDYPAVQIPAGPPVYELFHERLGRWKWEYQAYCIKCSVKKLKKMKPSDLQPRID